MRVVGLFVQENCWSWDLVSDVIVVRNHVQQFLFIRGGARGCAAIAEERLFYGGSVNRDWFVLLRVSGEAAAIFKFVFVVGRLVVIPDATIAVIFGRLA